MKNIKCADCAEYKGEWCEKIVDSPHPEILRDCQHYHESERRWRVMSGFDKWMGILLTIAVACLVWAVVMLTVVTFRALW